MKRLLLLLLIVGVATFLPIRAVGASSVQILLSQSCSSTTASGVTANFTWQGSDPSAIQQWVDVSTSNTWQPSGFQSQGPLDAQTTNLIWTGLPSKAVYYVRVNQFLPNQTWDPSATFTFTTPDCGTTTGAAANAASLLATLTVQPAAPMTGYSRAQFGPAWEDVDQNGCDTRNDVLQRDLVAFVLRSGSTCIVQTGTLQDPYTAKTIAFTRGVGTSDDVQIDHVVALGDAWRTGAATWDSVKRLHFANDPEHLLAVDGPANEAKGDRDASDWLPPNKDFDCTYVIAQVSIKVKYMLWVTPAEHDAMANVLDDCAKTPPEANGHTWYTSSVTTAKVSYCELDDGSKSLSPSNLRSFASLQALHDAFPSRTKSAASKC